MRRPLRLQTKTALLVAGICAGISLSSFALVSRLMGTALERQSQEKALVLAEALAERVAGPVIDGDVVPVHEALSDGDRASQGLAYAYVVGFYNEVFAHSFGDGFPRALLPTRAESRSPDTSPQIVRYQTEKGPILDVAVPLLKGMGAHVHVGIDESTALGEIRHLRQRFLALSVGFAGLGILAGIALSRRVARPLVHLADLLRRFGEGTLGEPADLRPAALGGGWEVLQLATAFREMIRQRLAGERALEAEKERLAVTLRSIGDGVIATDAEGRVALMNEVAEELTGWNAAQGAGRRLAEVFHIVNERTRHPCENPVEAALRTGRTVALANHTTLIARQGAERAITDSAAPIRDGDGSVLGVVLVFRDVTQKKKAEEELVRAEKLQSLGVLAGGIAHDFNNILTAILGNVSLARLLLDGAEGPARLLDEVERASVRARDLTQQLLTFSKGGAPIRKAASLREIVEESATFALRGSGVRLAFEAPADLSAAEVDAGQISQVVHNLVINAAQAMAGGGTVEVSCAHREVSEGDDPPLRPGRYVVTDVRDNGVGIPPEALPRIFDPYFTTKAAGSGLGLATAYSIIQNHDGFLGVSSQIGGGTVFSFYLPATDEPVQQPEASQVAPEPAAGRILLMDDEAMIRDAGGELLGHLGYEVSVAKDGEEAVRLYAEARAEGRGFAAVIMDLTVPGGMGGLEALRRLEDIDPTVTAIVSSGYSNDPIMADYRKQGFRGVVAKPYRIQELADAVGKALAAPVPRAG